MKKNLVTLLGVAFVVAIMATGLFYGLIVSRLNQNSAAQTLPIVVAARDLEPGTVLKPSDVKLAQRDSGDALVEGFSSDSRVTGLTLMEKVPVDQPIAREILVSKESSRGAALGIPPGLRAISVHVADSTGVVELLQPGYHVDAQLVHTEGNRQGSTTTLRTVLQNLEVLKVEDQLETKPGQRPLPVVTLLAYPDEADVLGLADAAAQIRLILRHPLDDEMTQRSRVALAGIMQKTMSPKRSGSRISQPTAPLTKENSEGKPVETAAVKGEQP